MRGPVGRPRRQLGRWRSSYDLRTGVLAAVCATDAAGALVLVDLHGLGARSPWLTWSVALVSLSGVWALVRRRLTEVECAAVLTVFVATATVQVLGYDSADIRWASVYGLAGIPMITLMLARVQWAALVGAACITGQITVVASIPHTPVELATSVAIVSVVLPLICGNTALLLRRSEALRVQAQQAARSDHLTGLLNRRGLKEDWPGLVAAAQRRGQQLGVLLIDLDHFKAVNDAHGHDTGDQLLEAVGSLLRRSVRQEDLAVRLGGEELAVLGCFTDEDGAAAAAEGLRAGIAALRVVGAPAVTASIGVALARPPAAEGGGAVAGLLSSALRLADLALYDAKGSGRNTVARASAGPLPVAGAAEAAPAALAASRP